MGDRNPQGMDSFSADFSTTLSATLDSSGSASNNSKSYVDISRVELEKRQLVHTIQLLKLELSQKQLLLDTDRNEHASQLEELQEQVADTRHEKKLAELRLQSVACSYEQELKDLRLHLQERNTQRHRDQDTFTDTDTILGEVRREVEETLTSIPVLSMDEQKHFRSTDLSRLAIGDYVRLRFFELTKPLQKHTNDLQRRIGSLNQQLSKTQAEVLSSQDLMEEERERCRQLERQCSTLTTELTSVKTHVQEGNYKVEHFDSVRRERDALKTEVERLSATVTDIGRREGHLKDELDKVTKDLSSAKQSAELLSHDKDYLTRQVTGMSTRTASLEEKLDMVTEELAVAKQEKDRLFRDFMNSKEEERLTYSHKLETELESLRQKMGLEMETLKARTKETYDRESKVLSEARDAAVMDRDRAVASERDIAEKYEGLLKEHHSLQGVSGRRLAEIQGDLQLVRFDKDRQGLVHEELVKDHRHLQLEYEKLQKKVELLTEEVWCVRREGEAQIKMLEAQLLESKTQLQGYDKVEKELDDIVMQSAQLEHSCDAEQVLFTYGFGTSIPTNSKRRLQQSVHLARRVLHLEKVNSGLRDQLRWEGEKVGRLQEDLESGRELLLCSQQPGGYLIERVKEQQEKLQHSGERVRRLEGEMAALKEENAVLRDTQNKMSADLERLLSHREEMQSMKAFLTDRGARASSVPAIHTTSKVTNHDYHSTSVQHHHQVPPCSHTHQPRPTVFTKQSLPSASPSLPHQS